MPFVPGMRVTLKALKPHVFPDLPNDLGRRVRHRRGELGLSQEEAASKIGVTLTRLQNWENKGCVPRP